MPKRIPKWFSQHPNLFAFGLVVLVFIWAIMRIGDESDKRVAAGKIFDARLTAESQARQEIICLIANDGVDRDKGFIDGMVEVIIETPPRPGEDPDQVEQRKVATREFFTRLFNRLEPSLRPIECKKFINDPVRYLRELRQRVDINPSTTTTIVKELK